MGGGARSDLGLTDFFPLEVLAGDYQVEITRSGYQTETQQVSIAAHEQKALSVDLVRVLASLFLVTQPPGVEVWVDGELRATTAGNLEPERARFLAAFAYLLAIFNQVRSREWAHWD